MVAWSPLRLCSLLLPPPSPPRRFFDGSVAHLMLFDAALHPGQVAQLYNAYKRNNGTGSGGGASGGAGLWAPVSGVLLPLAAQRGQ